MNLDFLLLACCFSSHWLLLYAPFWYGPSVSMLLYVLRCAAMMEVLTNACSTAGREDVRMKPGRERVLEGSSVPGGRGVSAQQTEG